MHIWCYAATSAQLSSLQNDCKTVNCPHSWIVSGRLCSFSWYEKGYCTHLNHLTSGGYHKRSKPDYYGFALSVWHVLNKRLAGLMERNNAYSFLVTSTRPCRTPHDSERCYAGLIPCQSQCSRLASLLPTFVSNSAEHKWPLPVHWGLAWT